MQMLFEVSFFVQKMVLKMVVILFHVLFGY